VLVPRCGNTLRFPGAAGEPPNANALRGLTDASTTLGVSVVFPPLASVHYHCVKTFHNSIKQL